jgi:nitroreductase
MDTIIQAIEGRRARRALAGNSVPKDVLDRILTAATFAPSCMNKQPWRFLVADDPAALEKARAALSDGNYWARKAPVLIAALTKPELDCRLNDRREYALFDLGLAVANLLAQATAEGLIAHPMAGFNPLALKSAFGIDDSHIIPVMIAVAWPGDAAGLNDKHRESETGARDRAAFDSVVQRNRWESAAE